MGPCTARSADPQVGITWGLAGSAGSQAVPQTHPVPQSVVASRSGRLLFRRILWATDLGRAPPTALPCQRWHGVRGVVSWPVGPSRRGRGGDGGRAGPGVGRGAVHLSWQSFKVTRVSVFDRGRQAGASKPSPLSRAASLQTSWPSLSH